MNLLTHSEDRRLLFRMATLSLVAILLVTALSLVMTFYVNRAIEETFASIVGTVTQKYPKAEAQVVQDLRSPSADSVNRGAEVLGKYGMGDQGAADTSVAIGLLARLLPVALALIALPVRAGAEPPARLAAYGNPLLLMAGDHDDVCPAAALRDLAASLPGAVETRIVTGTDHFWAGYEGEIAGAVGGFFADHLTTGAVSDA